MGGSYWSATDYAKTTKAKVDSGTAFGYDAKVRSGSAARVAHESLDPKVRNRDGELLREARDSVDHPNSVPIVVGFDATGSMGTIPRTAQKNLGRLFELLLVKGYVEDPQIAITAYGDANCDSVPLQLSQFESDNRIDDNLDSLFLEGGGGGNDGETQSLLWYFLANHVVTDAFEKRGKKGYLFIIADEKPLDLTQEQVERFIAPDEVVTKDLKVGPLVEHLKEKWDTYILFFDNWSAKQQRSREVYTRLFGADHLIDVEDFDKVADLIAGAIGYLEGTADDDTFTDDLVAIGTDRDAARRTASALAVIGKGSAVAKANFELPTNDEELATL